MTSVGIIGGAGYTAGELLRLLIHHPDVEVVTIQSESQAGKSVSDVHSDLIGLTDLVFVKDIDTSASIYFLCKGHGASAELLKNHTDLLDKIIIDLSQDFRLAGSHDFVYGLPELNRTQIKSSRHIANPGCFATCIQLGLLPVVHLDKIQSDIHISGITGSTGAGQGLSPTTHFSWRANNMSVYKAFTHQHLYEIGETIHQVNPQFNSKLDFIPYRGNFTRGIIITSYFETDMREDLLKESYDKFYDSHPFTQVTDVNPDIKMVVNTNRCLVNVRKHNEQAIVISVIDNLLKGASGQAVQNMNLILGIEETAGLNLKASQF